MNASELIVALQTLVDQHGDLPVRCDDGFGDNPAADITRVIIDYDVIYDDEPDKYIYLGFSDPIAQEPAG